MVYPKVRFVYDRQLEAEYICFLAKSISLGNYQKVGFTILSTPYPKTVCFPNLDYSPKFWQTINSCHNQNYGYPFPKFCIDEVLSKLPENKYQLDSSWSTVETQFFDIFAQFLDNRQTLTKVDKIDVLVTAYGTGGSFYSLKSGHRVTISATYRLDLPINVLAKTLLLALYKIQVRQHGETGTVAWADRQAVIDYLFTHSSYATLFPQTQQLSTPSQYITQGQEYLTQLGFSPVHKINLDEASFTPQEKKLLATFIENQSKIISFDQIANIIWGDNSDSKYSPAAMAKVISHLRLKIRQQGIYKEVITTKRGQGYFFT